MSATKCPSCTKTCYPLESINVDGVPYHKSCFKCQECKQSLTLKNFAMIHSVPYCKPHFKQLFASHGGRYEDAFGNDPNHKQWEKVNYSPGLAINATVIDNSDSPARERGATVSTRAPSASVSVSSPLSASSSSAAPSGPFEEIHAIIKTKDLPAARAWLAKHGLSSVFLTDNRKRSVIEVAFAEGAPSIGAAFVEALSQQFNKLSVDTSSTSTSSSPVASSPSSPAPSSPVSAATIPEEPANATDDSAASAAPSTTEEASA